MQRFIVDIKPRRHGCPVTSLDVTVKDFKHIFEVLPQELMVRIFDEELKLVGISAFDGETDGWTYSFEKGWRVIWSNG